MPDLSSQPRKLSAPERRQAIVEAAVELFSRKGFRGTTTRELAAAVGVSEPVLYQHFETKRALYTAMLEAKMCPDHPQAVADLARHDEAGDSHAFFSCMAGLILDWYIEDPRYARLLLFSHLEEHELSDLFYQQRVAVFYGWVTRHLERQMQEGRVRLMDSLLAARVFAGMIAHQGMIAAIYKPGDLPGGRDAVVKTVVDIFLHGIRS